MIRAGSIGYNFAMNGGGSVLKKFLLGVMIWTSLFTAEAVAKNLPEVVWSHEICTMTIADDYAYADKRRGYQLLNSGTPEEQRLNREKISRAIDAKLRAQEKNLPFKIKTTFDAGDLDERNFELNDQTVGANIIALVPIVVIDYAIETAYVIGGRTYHKYLIVSAIDIAFCSEDADGALTILSNIPLHFYETIPLSNSLDAMTERERSDLARTYANFTADMIAKHLDFTKARKALRGLETKQFGETYRVESVDYSSQKAREILGMNRDGQPVKLMQRIAGNIFTGDFAARTGHVVYPMILDDDTSSWTTDAAQNFYVAKMMTTHSGEKIIRMPAKVDHKIYLDVTGAGSREIETKYRSNINGFKMYRLWMRTRLDGKSVEVTNDIMEEFFRGDLANRIIKDEAEIFGGLMIGAAVKSAEATSRIR